MDEMKNRREGRQKIPQVEKLGDFVGRHVKVVFNDIQKNGDGKIQIIPKTADGILDSVDDDHIVIDGTIAIFRSNITFIRILKEV